MKQKGIEQYLDTAIAIREEYPNTEFHIWVIVRMHIRRN